MQGTLQQIDVAFITFAKADGAVVTKALSKNVAITRDGHTAAVEDLQVGDHVSVSGNPVKSVGASCPT